MWEVSRVAVRIILVVLVVVVVGSSSVRMTLGTFVEGIEKGYLRPY